MKFQDYYKTLGVPKTASEAEIKKAFRDAARKYHPDKTKGDKDLENKFSVRFSFNSQILEGKNSLLFDIIK